MESSFKEIATQTAVEKILQRATTEAAQGYAFFHMLPSDFTLTDEVKEALKVHKIEATIMPGIPDLKIRMKYLISFK